MFVQAWNMKRLPWKMRVPALALTVAIAISTAMNCTEASTLGTEGQRAQETLALRVLASPAMRDEVVRLEQRYHADPQGSTASGKATIRRAVDAISLAAVQYAISSEDSDRPIPMWVTNAPHQWFGLNVPRSGYGIDNPDNVHRQTAIDGASRYEIHGKIKRPGPAQLTFIIYGSIPGMGQMSNEGGAIVSVLSSQKMAIGADGSFTITVDSDDASGRPNHMRSTSEAKLLIVRDALSDWTVQNPVALEIQRVSGPPLRPQPSEVELGQRAAQILATIGPYWLDYDNRFIYTKPVNKVTLPRTREGGWGFATSGHFKLADDEVLVLTLDSLGAGYLGFQLTDPWGVALEYIERNGSLNLTQAKPNPDGTYTYVIAAKDPGTYNWLDTSGLDAGIFAIRWQALPPGARADRAVISTSVMKVAALKQALIPGTPFASSMERKAQLKARTLSYERRLTE